MVASAGFYWKDHGRVEAEVVVPRPIAMPTPWPPVMNREFPDLELVDHRGNRIYLSDFRGKVILLEPIGMTCPACNAMAGAAKKGNLAGPPMPNAMVFEDQFEIYTKGIAFTDERLVVVQFLLYNLHMQAPTEFDTKLWAEHYHFDQSPNIYVTAPIHDLRNQVSYDMVPGFYLIDKDFILRSDATGHRPKHSLYRHLLPLIPELLAENHQADSALLP